MRVTSQMMTNNYLKDMNRNLSYLNKINKQMTTGKEISRPSDDPFKIARTLQLTASKNANTQYNQNIKDTINYLDTTDQALYQATNVVGRIRELMVSSGNAAYGSKEAQAINDEIQQRVEELTQVFNTSFDGKYIFGGTKTASKPLNVVTDASTGAKKIVFIDKEGKELPLQSEDAETMRVLGSMKENLYTEVSQGVTIQYNVKAMDIFSFENEEGKAIDVIDLLSTIQENLLSSDRGVRSKLLNENLHDIDSVVNRLLSLRSEVGAKQNRMESAQQKNEDESLNLTDILSKTEDIDFTQKSIEFAMAQTTYTAALQVSSKVLPKTLLDYL